MELIGNFGIDLRYLIAQIVNFLIIFFVLKRFAYKPVLELLKNRENTIREGLKQAEEARLLLEKATEKEKEILKNANQEARQFLDEAKKQRSEILAKSEQIAKKQTEELIKEAREQIVQETREAQNRLSTHISKLAVDFLQKSITQLFTEKDQEQIMKNAIKKLKHKPN